MKAFLLIVLLVVVLLVVLLVLWFISTSNSLVRSKNSVDEAFSTMDVYLLKRYDLIPNLVSTVKGYAKHESDTLEKIVNARNAGMSKEEKMSSEGEISNQIKNIFALVESYPDLKANQSFLSLQDDLNKIENDIANARKYYNGVVKRYNNSIQTFPSSIVANYKGFLKEPLFEVKYDEQRENVKVEL